MKTIELCCDPYAVRVTVEDEEILDREQFLEKIMRPAVYALLNQLDPDYYKRDIAKAMEMFGNAERS